MEQVFALERTSLRGVSCGFLNFYLQYEFQFEKYPMNYSGIPTFLCSLIYCVISVWVSPVYAEYISTAIVTHRYFRFLRRKCIYAYCFLIVNRFVVFFLCSLIYCYIGLSVSGLRKIRFNAYTPVEFPQKISSQRNQDSRCPR